MYKEKTESVNEGVIGSNTCTVLVLPPFVVYRTIL